MRIARLQVYGFGRWQDAEWEFAPGLNIICGQNEAGKTTLMMFIRAILFGFESRKSAASRYEPHGGGRYGGAVTLVDENGAVYRVERVGGGKSAGEVKVDLPDGGTAGEEFVAMLLGRMSDKVFKNIFAFGLTELQQIETLQGDEINGFLYHTGTGSGLSILGVQKALQSQEESLFKPNGRTTKIAQTLHDLEAVTGEIDELRAQSDRFNRHVEELERVEERLHLQAHRVADLEGQVRWGEELGRQEETYLRWLSLQGRLAQLPEPGTFPQDGLARLDKALDKRREAEAECHTLKRQEEAERRKVDEITSDERMLQAGTRLTSLRDGLALYQERAGQVHDHRLQVHGLARNVDELRSHLGVTWTDEEIEGFDASLVALRYVDEQGEKARELNQAGHWLDLRDKELGEEAERLQQEEVRLLAWQEKLPQLADDGLRSAADRAGAWLQEQLPQDEWRRQQAEELQNQLGAEGESTRRGESKGAQRARNMETWVLLGAAILLPAILILLGQPLAAGLVLVTFVALLVWRGRVVAQSQSPSAAADESRTDSLHQQLTRLQEERARLQSEAQTMLRLPGLPVEVSFTRDGLRRLDEWRRAQDDRRRDWQQWEAEWADLGRRHDELEKKQTSLAQDRTAWSQRQQAWHRDWSAWLQRQGLPENMSPKTAEEILRELQKGKELLRRKRDLLQRMGEWQENVERFERDVRGLADELGVEGADSLQVPVLLQMMTQRFDTEREKAGQLQTLNEKISTLVARCEEKEELLMTTTRELNNLYHLAGLNVLDVTSNTIGLSNGLRTEAPARQQDSHLDDVATRQASLATSPEESFRRLAALLTEREQSLRERDELRTVLLRSLGGEHEWQRFLTEMEARTPEDRARELDELRASLAEEKKQQQELLQEKGRLSSWLADMRHSESLSAAQQQYQLLAARLDREARDWAVAAVAKRLLQQTMHLYESEKQPDVIRQAARYFRLLTGGRYTNLFVPLGEKHIEVERADGVRFQPASLSRGTVEQLYLAMRFALVAAYRKQAVLPMVLDDILVNFDPVRAEHALAALGEIAGEGQILFFTCHPQVGELCRNLALPHHAVDLHPNETHHAKKAAVL
jgi:uncharacterized protein YhaN